MDKVRLTDKAKEVMRQLKDKHEPHIDSGTLALLTQYEFVTYQKTTCGPIWPRLTDKGLGYFELNPTLKDPSFWDDKRNIITIISLIANVILVFVTIIQSIR